MIQGDPQRVQKDKALTEDFQHFHNSNLYNLDLKFLPETDACVA